MPLPTVINFAYSGQKRCLLVPRDNQPHQVQLPDPSIEKFWSILVHWSITGLAALHKRSIHTKPLGYKFTCMQGGPIHHTDSSAVGVLPSQESFLTWTSDSIVTMTTVCHYHITCMWLPSINLYVSTWNVCFQHYCT